MRGGSNALQAAFSKIFVIAPPGRRQTFKYRPMIRLTDNLRGWLDEVGKGWGRVGEAPMMWDGAIKRIFARHAVDCGAA